MSLQRFEKYRDAMIFNNTTGEWVHYMSHKELVDTMQRAWDRERALYERTIELLTRKCL